MGDDMPGDRLPEQDCRLAIRVSGLVLRHAVFTDAGVQYSLSPDHMIVVVDWCADVA